MAFRFESHQDGHSRPGSISIRLLPIPRRRIPKECAAVFQSRAPLTKNLDAGHADARYGVQRVLKTMPIGAAVRIEGPSGDLILQNDSTRAAVFLAGGIGITPFRSIVHWAAKEKLPQSVFLFYSNRRPEDAAFLADLQSLERANPKYKLIASMAEMEKSHQPWDAS